MPWDLKGAWTPPVSGFDWGGLASGAAPYVIGAMSTGGEIYSAQQNKAEAERNRQFQERMSNTAVQRSVRDYIAAGLNPALAYDRSASSPGGAQATIGNPLASGIANAQAARRQTQEMAAAKTALAYQEEKTRAEIAAIKNASARDKASEQFLDAQRRREMQTTQFEGILQPATRSLLEAQAAMARAGIPRAENDATANKVFGKFLGAGLNSADKAAALLKKFLEMEK